jgi:hypothetical protein
MVASVMEPSSSIKNEANPGITILFLSSQFPIRKEENSCFIALSAPYLTLGGNL